MPPRATIEEEFDDDTDLALPSKALPNTGTRGALLEEITSDDDGDGDGDDDDMIIPMHPTVQPRAPPSFASASSTSRFSAAGPPTGSNVTTDKSLFKNWTQIYPVYIDAKQPFKIGCRRIAREKSVWWPLSKEMAEAASVLGLNTVHESQAFHPRDWANPGRIRVNWKQNGKLVQSQFKTKKQLLEALAAIIQQRRPELSPTRNPQQAEEMKDATGASSSKVTSTPSKHKQRKIKTPRPPRPLPPLAERISALSPALEAGVLIDAVKAGMDAMKEQRAEAQNAAASAGLGKGKRKVVRMRG